MFPVYISICIFFAIAIFVFVMSFYNVKKKGFSHDTYKRNREKREKDNKYLSEDYHSKEVYVEPNKLEIKALNRMCPSCHLSIDPTRDKHCPHCGASLTNVCPHCHLINHETAFLCQECYAKLPYASKRKSEKKKDEEPLEF